MTGTMETPAAQPAPTAADAPTAARRVQKKTDWKRGAQLLVGGASAEAVAAALDITEDRLWTQLHRSLRFRHYIRQARERQLLLTHLQFDTVTRASAVRAGAKADTLDGSLLPPLIAALGLTAPVDTDERDVVDLLGRTGARPPRQAKHRRARAEIAAMHEEFQALKAISDAEQAAVAATRVANTESKLTETESKPAETESKLHETDSKPEETGSKPPQTAASAGVWRPDGPRHGPRHGPRNGGIAFAERAIVDLTDGAGRPLSASPPG
jgi:hypothetical protein